MKELIDKLAVHAGYLERYRSGDQRVMAGDIRAAIAALEAAEAKFEEARADNHRMALELADLLCERKELRETINSVAVCQKHVTEITAGACMICEIEQLREQAAQARRTSQYWKDCHIAGNAEIDKLRARVAHLESLIADIAKVAGRDVPDAIDNDGQPYQSQALDNVIRAALPAAPKEEV